jgi:xylose dehydrogenase (NAD/NADP)
VGEQDRIRWGILGAAGVATRRFVPALLEARNADLVTVGSRRLERAVALVDKAGQGRAVGSYQAVLDDSAVEVVYIPLPNSLHHEWILASLAAGKHVLCEKPLVTTVAAAEDVGRAARRAGRVVMEGFMYRFHPQYEPATWQPLLAKIGPLRVAQVRMSFPFDRPGDIREQAELGGGALGDIGCYCLDLLTWQLGEATEVQAIGDVRDGCDWTAAVHLRFGSGQLGMVWWSFAGPIAQRLTLVGEAGTLDLTSPFRATGPAGATLETSSGESQRTDLPTDNCFRRQIEHLGEVIRGHTVQAISLADSIRWLRVADRVREQLPTGIPASR